MTSILLAAIHPAVRDVLRAALESQGSAPVGVAEDHAEALGLMEEARPDILLLDADAPQFDLRRLTAEIARRGLPTRVALLGRFDSGASVLDAFRSGVGACVQRASAGTELLTAIGQMTRGHRYLSPGIVNRAIGRILQEDASDGPPLTRSETEVLRRVVRDIPQHEIARQLEWTQSTVERDYRAIKAKLRATHIGSLVRHAVRHHLVGSSRR
jgi:DNA-binding NarL/FixJ family response regulator